MSVFLHAVSEIITKSVYLPQHVPIHFVVILWHLFVFSDILYGCVEFPAQMHAYQEYKVTKIWVEDVSREVKWVVKTKINTYHFDSEMGEWS